MLILKAQKRTVLGKKVRQLRSSGILPSVIYGKGRSTEALAVSFSDFIKVWREAGETSVVELDIEGSKENVLISDVAFDPMRNIPIHADFLAVRMDQIIKAMVPIEFVGESPAVKNLGAVLVKVMHEIEVEALPADLPNEIQIDISRLEAINDRITISNIPVQSGVLLKANPEDVVVLVSEQRVGEGVPLEQAPTIEDIEVMGKREKKGGDEGEVAESENSDQEKGG